MQWLIIRMQQPQIPNRILNKFAPKTRKNITTDQYTKYKTIEKVHQTDGDPNLWKIERN